MKHGLKLAYYKVYCCMFYTSDQPISESIPSTLVSCLTVLRFMYDMALDSFDRLVVGCCNCNCIFELDNAPKCSFVRLLLVADILSR